MKAWGVPVSALTRCYDSIDAVIEHAREWEAQAEHPGFPDRWPGDQG